MSVTAKEIAKKLGVSQATVSVALNNKPGVSTTLKQKILQTASEMGYEFKRNHQPGNLPGRILIIVYQATGKELKTNPTSEDITGIIRQRIAAAGYQVHVKHFHERTENLNDLFSDIQSEKISGLVLIGSEISRLAAKMFASLNLPTVLVDAFYDTVNCTMIAANNMQGAYLATSYLISLYGVAPGLLESSYIVSKYEEREAGYRKALQKNSFKASSSDRIALSLSIEGAEAEMLEYIDSGKPIARCYFSVSDRIAIGTLKALRQRGYRIPEDVAIIGFGNIWETQTTDPPLTTVNVPRRAIGEIAVNCLIEEMETSHAYKLKIEVSTDLVKRASTSEE